MRRSSLVKESFSLNYHLAAKEFRPRSQRNSDKKYQPFLLLRLEHLANNKGHCPPLRFHSWLKEFFVRSPLFLFPSKLARQTFSLFQHDVLRNPLHAQLLKTDSKIGKGVCSYFRKPCSLTHCPYGPHFTLVMCRHFISFQIPIFNARPRHPHCFHSSSITACLAWVSGSQAASLWITENWPRGDSLPILDEAPRQTYPRENVKTYHKARSSAYT